MKFFFGFFFFLGLASGSTLNSEKLYRISELSDSDKEILVQDFDKEFTESCSLIKAETEVSGTCSLLDCLEIIHRTYKVNYDDLHMFMIQKWFDSMGILKLLASCRKPEKLTPQKKEMIRESAKKLTIFLTHVEYGHFKLDRTYMHYCLELFARAAPVSKFYDLFMEISFQLLTGDQKQLIFKGLLDTFDPNECKLFSVNLIQDADNTGLKFFQSWYQKLSECNFEGRDMERHLAKLTSSLLVSKLEDTEEFCDLLHLCLEKVSFPLLMSYRRSLRIFYLTLESLPLRALEGIIDKFIDVQVLANVPSHLRVAYGRVLDNLNSRHPTYVMTRATSVLPVDVISSLPALVEEFNKAYLFVISESEFVRSLEGPISSWDEAKLAKAADDLDYIGKNFHAVGDLDLGLIHSLYDITAPLIAEIADRPVVLRGASSIVTMTKFIFALLADKFSMVHVSSHFGSECIILLSVFNTQLWPLISKDPKMIAEVRSFYPIAFSCLEFATKNTLISFSEPVIAIIYEVIFSLSPEPAYDLTSILQYLLKDNLLFFKIAFDYLVTKPGFSVEPFYDCILAGFSKFEKLCSLEISALRSNFKLLCEHGQLISTTQLEFIYILKAVLDK